MASQSQGIQQLLAAEKKAAERVADARKSMSFYLDIHVNRGLVMGLVQVKCQALILGAYNRKQIAENNLAGSTL